MALELLAPAKLNLALEVTGRRPDGYHDIVGVMQTIDLADRLRLDLAPSIEIEVTGEKTLGVPLEGPRNLAYRAALALLEQLPLLGHLRREGRKMYGDAHGARIVLEKAIPAGMGLGGAHDSPDAGPGQTGVSPACVTASFWRKTRHGR